MEWGLVMQSDGGANPEAQSRLGGLQAAASAIAGRGPAPVHLWNPPHCGDIGMRIAADGSWHYRGSPISRPAMVRLFATILRKDPDGYVLVTPVEKVSIEVEDAPFTAVEMSVEETADGPCLKFRTNLDEWITADAAHPLRFAQDTGRGSKGSAKPYLLVRGGLEALVSRAVYYDLVARGESRDINGVPMYGVASGRCFFPIAPASEIEDPE